MTFSFDSYYFFVLSNFQLPFTIIQLPFTIIQPKTAKG